MVKPSSNSTPASSPTENGLDNNATSSSSSSCKYKGVRKRKWGKYVSEIRLPNSRERIWLGSYDSAEKAAKAFDAALFCLRGRDAKFNFPDNNPPDIVQGRSLNPQEIQAVAARFANQNNNNNNNNNVISSSNESHNNVGSTTSSSVSLSDGGAPTMQVESSEMMDWTSFLSMLDTNQEMSTSGYGFYPGLYPPPPPPDDVDDDDQNGGDAFSQSSFLWNF